MTTLRFNAYCGMSHILQEGDKDECRDIAAKTIRRRRRQGYPVVVLAPKEQWEIQEPDGACMVPDECGVLTLATDIRKCPWCGRQFEPETFAQRFCDEGCAEAFNS